MAQCAYFAIDPDEFMLKDSENSSGRSATFRIIYYNEFFKDIDFKFSAVLENSVSSFFMKTNGTFITQQKK